MSLQPALFAFLPQLGMMEMIVVMGVAVLLFGKRLPEVGRSLGKGIIEFKKGLRGIEEEFDFGSSISSYSTPSASRRGSDTGYGSSASSPYSESSVPKFEPPATPPVPQMDYQPEQPAQG